MNIFEILIKVNHHSKQGAREVKILEEWKCKVREDDSY
jgi:hypothetical protein